MVSDSNHLLRQLFLNNLQLISQTLNRNVSENTQVNLPEVEIENVSVNLGNLGSIFNRRNRGGNRDTLEGYLTNLLNEQLSVSTSLDTITGTLIAVQRNYIVIVESDGSLVLIPLSQIQSITEL